jgi:osmotically-inducible protein OsmY
MRRFFVGVALFTLAAVTPLAAWGGDREIAEQIYSKLKGQQSAGVLQGFTLDMDVTAGRVLLKGHVSSDAQRTAVLAAANSVDGVSEVVDQISVGNASPATSPAKPTPVKVDAVGAEAIKPATQSGAFSLSKALTEQAPSKSNGDNGQFVMPAGATESTVVSSDKEVKSSVVRTLGDAQRSGVLRGFGLEVSSTDGDVLLKGRAGSSETKQTIMDMVRRVPGVRNVIDDIVVVPAVAHPASAPQDSAKQVRHLQPVEVQTVSGRIPYAQDGPIATAEPMQFQGQPYAHVASMAPQGAVMAPQGAMDGGYVGGGYSGMPVPQGYGAPHYDSPNLPNYAWPGYAAYPNYAAVTYPQQYSPTAWPYIGPFYPYPQVPLGWRKVSLEWDDGWWFLDFTDK